MKLWLISESEIIKSFIEVSNDSKYHDKLKNEINVEFSLIERKNVYSAIIKVITKW